MKPSIKNKLIPIILVVLLILKLNQSEAHWGTRGPFGGSVTCMLSIDTNLYIGTKTGGVFRSSNKQALSWRAIGTGLTTGKINSLSSIGKYVIAGTDKGIFISKDNGGVWNPSNNLNNQSVNAIANLGNKLFSGTNDGIYVSSDSGKTWAKSSTGLNNNIITSLAISGTKVFAGTQGGGIFLSTNEGSNWNAENTNLSELNVTTLYASGGIIYAGAGGKIFSSPAENISWTNTSDGLPSAIIYNISGNDSDLYVATTKGIYKSLKSPISWTVSNSGIPTDSTTSVIFFRDKLYAGTIHEGVYVSNLTPIQWNIHNNGFSNLRIFDLFVKDLIIITATEKGLFISKDEASNYTRSNKGISDSLNITSIDFNDGLLAVATKNNGVFISSDTGKTWAASNTDLTDLSIVKVLIFQNKIFAGTQSGKVFTTSISVIKWESAGAGLPDNIIITDLKGSESSIYLTSNGKGVFILQDKIWNAINQGLGSFDVREIEIGEYLYIATANGIFKSTLSSISWNQSNTGLANLDVRSIGIFDNFILASYPGGIQFSRTKAEDWENFGTLLNLPTFSVVDNVNFSKNRIFVSTPDNANYSNSKGELPVGIFDPQISFELVSIVSPNPNNGVFTLALNEKLKNIKQVNIYNNYGQLILTDLGIGEKITTNLHSGLYYIELLSADSRITSKFIVE